jgi:sugar (glycoside-pentoside-hexuronide) transporter
MNSTEVIQSVNVIEPEERKLKFSEKLSAVLNGTTGVFHSQVIQMFLLFYYTDIMKISAAYVAGLFLVARIVDAFLAPIFGIYIDKVNTRWGKYKPWYIWTGALIGIFGWLTFTNFHLGSTGNLIYATITYFIYSGLKSMEQAPANALIPAITKSVNDRISLNQIGYFFMMVAILFAQIGIQPLYKRVGGGDPAFGFSIIMGVVAVIGILIAVYQQYSIKERYIAPVIKVEDRPSIKEMIVALIKNKYALIVFIYVFAINLAGGIRSGITIYYFKYFFHNEGLMVIAGMVGMLPTLIGVVFSPMMTKRIGIRKNLLIGIIVGAVTTAAIVLIPPTSTGVTMYLVLSVVGNLFVGLSTPAQGTMMPAAIDYSEWRTGKNINAFMGSFLGFLQTFATAISGAIAAGSLSVIGYVAGAAEQSSSTLLGFKVLMSVVPAVITLLQLAILWYDLSESKQAEITKDLADRRKNA